MYEDIDLSNVSAASIIADLYVQKTDKLNWLVQDLKYAQQNVESIQTQIALVEKQIAVIEQLIAKS